MYAAHILLPAIIPCENAASVQTLDEPWNNPWLCVCHFKAYFAQDDNRGTDEDKIPGWNVWGDKRIKKKEIPTALTRQSLVTCSVIRYLSAFHGSPANLLFSHILTSHFWDKDKEYSCGPTLCLSQRKNKDVQMFPLVLKGPSLFIGYPNFHLHVNCALLSFLNGQSTKGLQLLLFCGALKNCRNIWCNDANNKHDFWLEPQFFADLFLGYSPTTHSWVVVCRG